mmetsp:Transcript_33385/g.72999  ORF Transcript_33385/g.72999 Transcript_33385/m.72999 type:complete len:332 (-) Transcript_33385:71-1066(-)
MEIQRTRSQLIGANKWLLFFHESMRPTANRLKDLMGDNLQLSELEWNHFNDGFPDLQVKFDDAQALEMFYGTCLLVSFHTPAVIFEQLALLYALPKMRARNFRVILPWFCTGTMERVETLGQVATAATLARMLSHCPMGPSGPVTYVIYDIHALQEQFYFGDTVLVELKTAVWILKDHLKKVLENCPGETFAIVYPDDGAHKRFKAKFNDFYTIVCNKVRKGEERLIEVKEGDPKGKHCVIIDDLVQSGGTLLQCAKPLKEMGATKVSCWCTHGVFPQNSFEKFFNHPLIHKFWVTDSVPTTAALVDGKAPFEVLSLAPLIRDYLMGNFNE